MKFFRPTEDTQFRIDYAWFDGLGQDVNVLIYKCLSTEQRDRLGDMREPQMYDFIDEHTGEVARTSQVLQIIRRESAMDRAFITPKTPVFEAAFRLFLINGNAPLTARELAERMGRKPADILAQIGGRVVYNGIRPYMPS